jgi:hypothetical protein
VPEGLARLNTQTIFQGSSKKTVKGLFIKTILLTFYGLLHHGWGFVPHNPARVLKGRKMVNSHNISIGPTWPRCHLVQSNPHRWSFDKMTLFAFWVFSYNKAAFKTFLYENI